MPYLVFTCFFDAVLNVLHHVRAVGPGVVIQQRSSLGLNKKE